VGPFLLAATGGLIRTLWFDNTLMPRPNLRGVFAASDPLGMSLLRWRLTFSGAADQGYGGHHIPLEKRTLVGPFLLAATGGLIRTLWFDQALTDCLGRGSA